MQNHVSCFTARGRARTKLARPAVVRLPDFAKPASLIRLLYARRGHTKETSMCDDAFRTTCSLEARRRKHAPPGVQAAGFTMRFLAHKPKRRRVVWRMATLAPLVVCTCAAPMPSEPAVLLQG